MPIIWIDSDKHAELSQEDFDWIAERMDTSSSGTVSFSQSAKARFRKLTSQPDVKDYVLRAQMINVFGQYA